MTYLKEDFFDFSGYTYRKCEFCGRQTKHVNGVCKWKDHHGTNPMYGIGYNKCGCGLWKHIISERCLKCRRLQVKKNLEKKELVELVDRDDILLRIDVLKSRLSVIQEKEKRYLGAKLLYESRLASLNDKKAVLESRLVALEVRL